MAANTRGPANSTAVVTNDAAGVVGISVVGSASTGGVGCIDHYRVTVSGGTPSVGALSWPELHHDPQLSGTLSSTVTAATPTSVLGPNSTLSVGQQLVSANGTYKAAMQTDCNFVVYQLQGGTWTAVWQTHTYTHPNCRLAMQSDGNLVVYPSTGAALWQSGTSGQTLPTELYLQNDGNLVVYRGPSTSNSMNTWTPLWSWKTG